MGTRGHRCASCTHRHTSTFASRVVAGLAAATRALSKGVGHLSFASLGNGAVGSTARLIASRFAGEAALSNVHGLTLHLITRGARGASPVHSAA